MTAQATFSLDTIDAALAAAGPSLDPDEQHLAVAVLRLLSAGQHPGRGSRGPHPWTAGRADAAVLARGVLRRPPPHQGVLGPGVD